MERENSRLLSEDFASDFPIKKHAAFIEYSSCSTLDSEARTNHPKVPPNRKIRVSREDLTPKIMVLGSISPFYEIVPKIVSEDDDRMLLAHGEGYQFYWWLDKDTVNVSKLNEFLHKDTVNVILEVNIHVVDVDDEFVWGSSPNGKFSVKTSIPTSVVYVAASIGASYRSVNGPSVALASKAAEIIYSFGVPLVASALRLYTASSVPIVECCGAFKDGLVATERFNFKSIVVKGDSLLTINCVKNACEVSWRLKSHVRDVIHVASEFDNISFVHVFREVNFLVDALANLGHNLHVPKI
ncbi:hypothetical protein ACLB2K_048248 [Fragaria x ananassa]